MGIGGYFSADYCHDEDHIRSLQAGIEEGLTFLDTAEVYSAGHSEELVGKAIAGYRNRVFIATKVSPEHLGFDDVQRAAEASLERLNIETIDLYQVHWPNPNFPIAETVNAIERLIEKGWVRYAGVSNFSLHGFMQAQAEAQAARFQSMQSEYNLFDRTVEKDILPYCEEKNITFIAYTPLDKGVLLQEGARSNRLKEIAFDYDKTPYQIMLNWITSQPAVVAIPKATNIQHIRENAKALDFDLNPQHKKEIDQLFNQQPVLIPGDLIFTDKKGLENFVPGVDDLAKTLIEGEPLKPVRVVRSREHGLPYEYTLVEGKLRYWAWVSAFKERPLPALIRGD